MYLTADNHKTVRLEARVSADQKHLFQRAADLLGRTMTDFIISSLQESASKIIHEREILKLSLKDTEVFVQALLNPPSPNSKLLKAMAKHEKSVRSL